jgi:hypothetical protein
MRHVGVLPHVAVNFEKNIISVILFGGFYLVTSNTNNTTEAS